MAINPENSLQIVQQCAASAATPDELEENIRRSLNLEKKDSDDTQIEALAKKWIRTALQAAPELQAHKIKKIDTYVRGFSLERFDICTFFQHSLRECN